MVMCENARLPLPKSKKFIPAIISRRNQSKGRIDEMTRHLDEMSFIFRKGTAKQQLVMREFKKWLWLWHSPWNIVFQLNHILLVRDTRLSRCKMVIIIWQCEMFSLNWRVDTNSWIAWEVVMFYLDRLSGFEEETMNRLKMMWTGIWIQNHHRGRR